MVRVDGRSLHLCDWTGLDWTGRTSCPSLLFPSPSDHTQSWLTPFFCAALAFQGSYWWSTHLIGDSSSQPVELPCDRQGPWIVVANDKIPKGAIAETIVSFGFLGIYVTFSLGLWRLVRSSFTGLIYRIPYENLPYVGRLWEICEDLYLARDENELELEAKLFRNLIDIYRSPDDLYEYTKKND